jgi:hypothetical protein
MAHEISGTRRERDAMVYVGESPWHRRGARIDAGQARDLELVLERAGLDFQVGRRARHVLEAVGPDDPEPVDITRDGVSYRLKRSEKGFAAVRLDTRSELGDVDDVWHPLQNREAFEPLRSALDDGIASVETGGVLREGREVWMLVRFDRDHVLRTARRQAGGSGDRRFRRLVDTLEGEPGGGILPFGLFYNDHSGSRNACVKQTAIRVVCANTLEWSLSRRGGLSVEVPHDHRVRHAWNEAVERLFRELASGCQALADQREVLKETVLSEEAFSRLVLDRVTVGRFAALGWRIAAADGGSRWWERVAEEQEKVRGEVRRLWEEGKGHRGDRSAWEAYNGVVQWLDHSPSAPHAAGRHHALVTGTLARRKLRVYTRLLAFALDGNRGRSMAARDSSGWMDRERRAPMSPVHPLPT